MTLASDFLAATLDPGFAWCAKLPGWKPPASDPARVLLLAIAGQEGGWKDRVQQGGPAHGFWQFERGGGVAGVLSNAATMDMAHAAAAACSLIVVPPSSLQVYAALASPEGDNLAVAFARLLLWSDPAPLPALGDQDKAWDYYQRNWRPGAPGPDRWPSNYQAALAAVTGASP